LWHAFVVEAECMRGRGDCCRERTIEVWKLLAAARDFPTQSVAEVLCAKLDQQQIILPAKVLGECSGQL